MVMRKYNLCNMYEHADFLKCLEQDWASVNSAIKKLEFVNFKGFRVRRTIKKMKKELAVYENSIRIEKLWRLND